MAFNTADIIGILQDNVELRKSVLPISPNAAAKWADKLRLPRGGKTVIYTGFMYQLVPYISASVKYAEKFGDSKLAEYTGIARRINRVVNLTGLMALFSRVEEREYSGILQSVAKLLMLTRENFGYLYEDEIYAGALAHDLGSLDVFEAHASYVYRKLKGLGVKKLITVDPHTTNMLKTVYPKVVSGFDIEVKSYIEVLAENVNTLEPVKETGGRLVVHDSCVYARYEGVIDEPRALLRKAGYEVVEPENSGVFTFCCGGPVESLYPDKALSIAERRVKELVEYGDSVVTMCPICLANLRRVANEVEVLDIATYLERAFVEEG